MELLQTVLHLPATAGAGDHTQFLHGSTGHKTEDPWGAYLKTDGAHVDQGGTKWVDVSNGNWPDYNVHGVSTASHNETNLSFIGSVGVGGGQGNSDCVFGSCDDHDTFGVSGHGWYGPGNGEDKGNLWNPATQHGIAGGMQVSKELAVAPLATITEDSVEAAEKPTSTVRAARPSLGHYYLCGPALLLGAWQATAEAVEGRKEGSWVERLCQHATEAAGAVSPVGEHILGGLLPAPSPRVVEVAEA